MSTNETSVWECENENTAAKINIEINLHYIKRKYVLCVCVKKVLAKELSISV